MPAILSTWPVLRDSLENYGPNPNPRSESGQWDTTQVSEGRGWTPSQSSWGAPKTATVCRVNDHVLAQFPPGSQSGGKGQYRWRAAVCSRWRVPSAEHSSSRLRPEKLVPLGVGATHSDPGQCPSSSRRAPSSPSSNLPGLAGHRPGYQYNIGSIILDMH